MAYTTQFKRSVYRALQRLPQNVRRRIIAAIEALATDPRPEGCRKLQAPADLWRIRVGDYRVVFSIDDEVLVILILRVAHRSHVYRNL